MTGTVYTCLHTNQSRSYLNHLLHEKYGDNEMSLPTFIVITETQMKIERGEKSVCSAVEKLNSVVISWDQQQHFCGPQVVSGSQVGKKYIVQTLGR